MSGYQFIHVDTYARIPNKNFNKQSIWGIVHEADRVPHACLHIENPKKPILLYGEQLSKMAQKLYDLADKCRDSLGRKTRKDAQLLLAGVASYPKKSQDIEYNDEHFQRWLKLSVQFLKDEYGDYLRSIILHFDDELFPHYHFYCYPNPDENNRLNIRDVHVGMKARDTVSDKGLGSGKKRRKLYKDAMRAFQDRYYSKVGISSGLSRLGPKRQRMTRKEWRDEQNRCDRLKYYEQQKIEIEKLSKTLSQSNEQKEQLLEKLKDEKKSIEKENFHSLEISQASWFSKSSKVDYLVSKNTKLKKDNKNLFKKYISIKDDHQMVKTKMKSLTTQVSSLKTKLIKFQNLLNDRNRQLELIKEKYQQALAVIRDPLRLLKKSKKTNNNEVTYEG
jgi:hypothetical protein